MSSQVIYQCFSPVFSSSSSLFWMSILLRNSCAVITLTCLQLEYQTETQCCSMCPPGSRVKTDCKWSIPTSCTLCLEGTYTNKPTSLKHCFSCRECTEGSGLRIKLSCSPQSDTVCEPLEGFYCVDPSVDDCKAAQKHRSCEPGQYIRQEGTSSSDTKCSDCRNGTFSDGTFTSCQQHTQCETKNLELFRAGTASSDAECGQQQFHPTIIWIISLLSLTIITIALIAFCFAKCRSGRRRRQEALRFGNIEEGKKRNDKQQAVISGNACKKGP